MKVFSLLCGLLVAGLFLGASSQTASAQAANNQASSPKTVVIQRGDSLAKIAKVHSTTHVRLYDANLQIKNPDLIYAGDSLRIPRPDEKLASRKATVAPAKAKTVKKSTARVKAKPKAAVVANNFNAGVWDRLAACESGGNWGINTGNGYYGGLQFSLATWRGVGGSGYPHQNSKAEQIHRAQILQARSGWGQWPECSAKLGLR